jgi:polyisoprenoid-binding protein YceI
VVPFAQTAHPAPISPFKELTMKRLMQVFALMAALATPTFAFASTWTIDPDHSNISFKVRHMMVSNVKGEFGKFKGTVTLDDKDITRSRAEVTIDTASIDTRVAKRDEDLRSPNFLDVARYPTMTFVARKVEQAGNGRLLVTGDLTLHGVTRPVVLDVEGPSAETKDPWGNIRRGASATARINRKDFGLAYNKLIEAGGMVVGEDVNIMLEVEMIKGK